MPFTELTVGAAETSGTTLTPAATGRHKPSIDVVLPKESTTDSEEAGGSHAVHRTYRGCSRDERHDPYASGHWTAQAFH